MTDDERIATAEHASTEARALLVRDHENDFQRSIAWSLVGLLELGIVGSAAARRSLAQGDEDRAAMLALARDVGAA